MSSNYDKVSGLIKWQLHGERLHIDLNKYKLSDVELTSVLSQIKKDGREYELRRSSAGPNTLVVYWKPNMPGLGREVVATLLLFIALMLSTPIVALLKLLIYPLWTVASRICDGRWITLNEFFKDWTKEILDDEQ